MIETYLIGSIGQSQERIRQLRQILQGPYRREYDGLRQICLMHLDAVQAALLAKIVLAAKDGIEGIGMVTAKPDSLTPIVGLLNSAWQKFWQAPEYYQAWEAAQFETLRLSANTSQK